MRYQAIFFDLFNTLLHFDESVLTLVDYRGQLLRTSMLEVYQELQRRWDLHCGWDEFLDAFFEVSRQLQRLKADGREFPSWRRFEMLRQRLGIADESASEVMLDLHMEQIFRSIYLPEENRGLLESLHGYPKVLASNFDHAPTVRRALAAFGLAPHLQSVFISDEVGWRKPSPRFFEAIVEQSGFRPEECLFVGDDPQADCEGAGRAGFQVVWLNGNPDSPQPAHPPRWQISRLSELGKIVQGEFHAEAQRRREEEEGR